MKFSDVVHVYKKNPEVRKLITAQSAYYQISLKYMTCAYMIKSRQIYFKCHGNHFVYLKGFNVQHGVMVLIEKWKQGIYNGRPFDALMNDHQKFSVVFPIKFWL